MMKTPEHLFSRRAQRTPRSFIREILKVAGRPDVISFAGGLPHPGLFPVEELRMALSAAMGEGASRSIQYGPSEGIDPLREWVSERYRMRAGLDVSPENVLITTGSQQGLDLAGKVLVNEDDVVAMERPGYLGAIQAFSYYTGTVVQVPLEKEGPDLDLLEGVFRERAPKVFYAIPNFQNPSGLSYSLTSRRAVAELCERYGCFLVEDDPYGELRYKGEDLPPVASFIKGGSLLLGTFSKIGAPGLRLGWVVGDEALLERVLVAKQASDLHTSTLVQQAVWHYLTTCDVEGHIRELRRVYGRQRDCMVRAIRRYFPPEVTVTEPDGGMFLWMTLPEGCSSLELFQRAIRENVAFVPGGAFYVDGGPENTLRLNFSNCDEPAIEEGISRLGRCFNRYFPGRSS